MGIESKYVWMNGELVDYEKATVPFLNPALHYGFACFEGIRSYKTDKGPAIFRNREHMQRLAESAHIMGFQKLPFSVDELMEAARTTVASNGFEACYIRPLVYLISPSMGLNPDLGQAHVSIAAWEWGTMLGEEALVHGIRANISSFTRHHPNVMMTKSKAAGNYVNGMLAKAESARAGFDEAIMLDPQGYVAECTGENLFVVRKGKIYTTHTGAILEGITRDAIITLANGLGYEVVEQPIVRDQLYVADEVFMCGTAAECVPVREIDYRQIGDGKAGPVTRAIQKAFGEVVSGNHALSAGWLDYVKA
jgi:branched-chain amino acid aminotransferase